MHVNKLKCACMCVGFSSYKTDQGIKNLPVDRAGHLASSDPDYSIRDLFEAVGQGNYVSPP